MYFYLLWCSLLFLVFNELPLCSQSGCSKTIGIFTYIVPESDPWDPDSIIKGITGSEEAVIYISQQLALLGYQVIIFGNPPKDSCHSLPTANPRFVSLDYPLNFPNSPKFDIAISWRLPWNAQELKKRAHHVYFWPHDTCCFSLSNELIDGYDDILWLSQWQRQQWISLNPRMAKFHHIFGNGINPKQFKEDIEKPNPFSCIYSSNYARGLEILLTLWPRVKQEFPKATLDIYYGWQHWGLLTKEKEEKMREQMTTLAPLDITHHGLVSHEELHAAYAKASLWVYPCIAPEVFCITALKAQFSGAIPVVIKGSALAETVRHGFSCDRTQDYYATLIQALQAIEGISKEERMEMKQFILKEYTWETIARKWKELFDKNHSLLTSAI